MNRLFFIATVLTLASVADAGPMIRHLETVTPRLGQRGTTVEVALRGVALSDPRQVVFYRPGIKAIDFEPARKIPARGLMHGARIDQEVRCKFVIAADCPLGEHPFRLLTRTDMTVIGTFHVTPFPVINEDETANNSIATAKPIALNVTLLSKLRGGSTSDRDLYRVDAKAGQRLSVEVDSVLIANNHYGDSEFDVQLRVLDQAGKVLAANDDNPLRTQDPIVSLKVPADGPLFVEASRSVYVDRETTYAIHIGHFKRPLAAYPPGGQVGARQTIKFLGDPLGDYTETITIGSREENRRVLHNGDGRYFHYFADAASPLKLRASPYPNVLEDTSATATIVRQLPAALNGIISTPTERDRWRIAVTKGKPLSVRVLAAGLGSPIDAAIRILPIEADGTLGEPEITIDDAPLSAHEVFGTGFRGGGGAGEAIDPSVLWTPKRDGLYELEIRDTSGAGLPTGIYRIEIESQRSIIQTVLQSRTNDWTESMRVSGLIIPRGNRWTIDLTLPDGHWARRKAPFQLSAIGLPAGVRIVSPPVPPNASRWTLQLEADNDAELRGATIRLTATPIDADGLQNAIREVRSQQNVPFINHSGGDAWRMVRTDRYAVGVTDAAPFSIDIEAPPVALVRGGELAIPVKLTRHNGFNGPVEIRCGSLPRSISIPPPVIIPAGQSAGVYPLGASTNAALETIPLYLLGSTVRDDISPYLGAGHIRVSTRIVNLKVAQPYVELASQPASIRRGEQKPFIWSIRHHAPFEGKATVKLLGLPKGVAVTGDPPTVTVDSKSVSFALKATSEALLGAATGLQCEVTVTAAGQQITQRTGRGTLRIDPAKSN